MDQVTQDLNDAQAALQKAKDSLTAVQAGDPAWNAIQDALTSNGWQKTPTNIPVSDANDQEADPNVEAQQ